MFYWSMSALMFNLIYEQSRILAYCVFAITTLIAIRPIFFTATKQGLHDRLAGFLVVEKKSLEVCQGVLKRARGVI